MRKVRFDMCASSFPYIDDTAGFLLILEPFETDNATVPNPIFHLT